MSDELMILAGEASADLYAADILRNLQEINPNLHAFGVGGSSLLRAGMEIIVPSSAISVMGFTDWLGRAREVMRAYQRVVRELKERRPSAVLMLDLPDFNLRLAKHCHRLDIPVIYFISPQVWAWRPGRIAKIRQRVTKMLVIFPFEEPLYLRNGVDAEFVGHPLLPMIRARVTYRTQGEILQGPRIALLPGSRPSELDFHMPVLEKVCQRLLFQYPGVEFRLPVASTVKNHLRLKTLAEIKLFHGTAQDVLRWADLALVASGTATLETALVGTPQIVFYRVARMTELIFRLITRYRDFVALPNVIAQSQIIPEFIQNRFSVESVLTAVDSLIKSENERNFQIEKYRILREALHSKQVGMDPARVVASRVNAVFRDKNIVEGRRLLVEPTFS